MTGWSVGASIAPGTLRRQSAAGAVVTASQSTTTLTVTAVTSGRIYLGMLVTTTPPTAGGAVRVTALGTGTGGTGTYTLSTSATVASTTWTGAFEIGNARTFVATQSSTGTTGSTEPSWSITKGAATTDNTVTWIECTGQSAVNGDMTNTPRSSSVRSTAPGRGKIILNNAATHIFIQSSAGGTCGSGEPTYSTSSVGSTTTDNTVIWTYIGTSFSSWAAPFAFLAYAFGTSWAAAGDSVFIGDDHSEVVSYTTGAGISAAGTGASPNFIYSIDHTVSLPVSSTGLKFGALISYTGPGLTINGGASGANTYFFGITFSSGTGSSTTQLSIAFGGVASWNKFENCLLKLNTTSSSALISTGFTSTSTLEFSNTAVQFGAAGQSIRALSLGKFIWRNTGNAVLGTAPTALFTASSNGITLVEGVDLSGATNTIVGAGTSTTMGGLFYLENCKIAGGATIAATPVNMGGPFVDALQCSSSATSYVQRRYLYQGTLTEETTVIRTTGASDGTNGISWKIATTANAKWYSPFESFNVAVWNDVTGTNRVVTMCGIWNSAGLPNNDDIWLDVCYLGSSGSTLGSWATSTKASNLATGSAVTADSTSAWDSVATTRQNSHAYALGDVIKVASNSGRIFFCTTAGTTAGSLPGGYASAVDGGSVTDNTAVFRAGMRFSLGLTLSSPKPQLVGYLEPYVKVAKVSSTFYIDPVVTLS